MEENNFNLNEKTNLNPSIDTFKQMDNDERKKMINDWENKPSVKEKQIGGYDKRTETTVRKNKLGFLYLMAFLGVLSLIIVGGVIGYSFYYNYSNYQELTLFPKQVCAPVMPQCPELPEIPECPAAPDCTLTCGSYNINVTSPTPVVNVFTNSS